MLDVDNLPIVLVTWHSNSCVPELHGFDSENQTRSPAQDGDQHRPWSCSLRILQQHAWPLEAQCSSASPATSSAMVIHVIDPHLSCSMCSQDTTLQQVSQLYDSTVPCIRKFDECSLCAADTTAHQKLTASAMPARSTRAGQRCML